MKKLLSIMAAALLALALTVPALADVIWEPMDDFYETHRDECTYTAYTRYEAQKDAPLYISPENKEQVGTIAAGEIITVEYLWNGNGAWGAAEVYLGEEGRESWKEGWVELTSFRRLYGEADFEADHADEIREVDGDLLVTKESPTVFWLFPGSGEVVSVAGGPDSWIEEETVSFNRVWTDGDGNEWGEVGYFYGIRGAWVYLADPAADDLPATAPRYAEPEAEATPEAAERPVATTPAGRPIRTVGPVITVVVFLAAVTVILIFVLPFKKGRH